MCLIRCQSLLVVEDDFKTYKEVMMSQDVAFWKEAINDEIVSYYIIILGLLLICLRFQGIGFKWVFKRKYNTNGSIQTFETRLVAKDFRQ